jgi:hypothetical protein
MTYVNVSGGHFELEDTIKCYTMYCVFDQLSQSTSFIYSGEVCSIQHYATGQWFSLILKFPPSIKMTATI